MDIETTQRLHIMHCQDLSDLFWPAYDSLRGVEAGNIGAIISVEPYKADPNQENKDWWRLTVERTEDVPRHFTEVFYSGVTWQDAKTPRTEDEHTRLVVNQRLTALSKTLDYADAFLKSDANKNKNLVVHDYCARYFSPALMLAILTDQFPAARDEQLIDTLKNVNHVTTVLKNGELAFVDAAMQRNGGLIRAWHAAKRSFNDPEEQFDLETALTLHDKFKRIIDNSETGPPPPPQRRRHPPNPPALPV